MHQGGDSKFAARRFVNAFKLFLTRLTEVQLGLFVAWKPQTSNASLDMGFGSANRSFESISGWWLFGYRH
ncbi:hypothetical protein O9929_05250 [Vibrio lentus]|nr:hypothetical protein [Vibrio lentus]